MKWFLLFVTVQGWYISDTRYDSIERCLMDGLKVTWMHPRPVKANEDFNYRIGCRQETRPPLKLHWYEQ